MILSFQVKYGENVLVVPLYDGTLIKTAFYARYGKNKILFPTNDRLSIEFDLKYGENIIEIPISKNTKPAFAGRTMAALFRKKVTIYNDIPGNGINPRRFNRFVMEQCSVQGGYLEKADGTIQNIVNAQTVITKDIGKYRAPEEYAELSDDERQDYYTVQVGDYIVFGEVNDRVTSAQEFAQLQQKYKNIGIKVTSVSEHINGMTVDHISMTNV